MEETTKKPYGKISFDMLAFEVTRKCNMCCEHCLRGEAQNMDITESIIDNILAQTESINNICFTGGEPSLNVKAIKYVLEYCRFYNIPVYSFFVATNGKKVSMEFIFVMLEWYAYCIKCGGEPELCMLALSRDEFHENIPNENIQLLKGLSFFDLDCKDQTFSKNGIINEGRGKDLQDYYDYELKSVDRYHETPFVELEDCGDYTSVFVRDGYIYVSANGIIKSDCDCAFDNNQYQICTYEESLADALVEQFYEED